MCKDVSKLHIDMTGLPTQAHLDGSRNHLLIMILNDSSFM